ncbi:hypothetical protein EVAR_36787_1 [Eumeta japonica]|uniref:Uncharacterized protein n=1 Tax=Eumeta variegata TaxID=151549 RepID=A0A4C1WYS9_EUMVA|nr:hypothetical protein EVAR_36787_1 [Eumeta japonica]
MSSAARAPAGTRTANCRWYSGQHGPTAANSSSQLANIAPHRTRHYLSNFPSSETRHRIGRPMGAPQSTKRQTISRRKRTFRYARAFSLVHSARGGNHDWNWNARSLKVSVVTAACACALLAALFLRQFPRERIMCSAEKLRKFAYFTHRPHAGGRSGHTLGTSWLQRQITNLNKATGAGLIADAGVTLHAGRAPREGTRTVLFGILWEIRLAEVLTGFPFCS